MPRRHLLRSSAVAVLLLAGVGACGGDDSGSDDAATNTENELEDLLDDEALDDAADAAGVDDDCLAVALEYQNAFGQAGAAMANPDGLEDFGEIFGNLADRLPELADEFQTLADAFDEAADGDVEALSSDEYQDAADSISAYFDERCDPEG